MKKTIIYIMSNVRSGSTLLEHLLSQNDNAVTVGELHQLHSFYHHGPIGKTIGYVCGCGVELRKCTFWNEIVDELKSRGYEEVLNTRVEDTGKFILCSNKGREKSNIVATNLINCLYELLFTKTNKNIIIDSSKNPWHGLTIYKNTKFDFKIIYIKRDIRAVTLSKIKWEKRQKKRTLNNYKVLLRTKLHELKIENCLSEIGNKDKICITYKQLSQCPEKTIHEIGKKFNIIYSDLSEYMMPINNQHPIAGTPNRFTKRKIIYDDSWEAIIKDRPFFNIIGKILDKV